MTIGERIAQVRKENGLSQEAFGEVLGVSRQAISKWESNQSVPEVDKLLSIHRLYGVSVGWLLGTEEEREKTDAVSEEQLEQFEAIVRKYIGSIPQTQAHTTTQNKANRIWKITALVFLTAFLINSINVYNRFNQLDNQQQNLEYSIDRIQSSVDNEVQSIGNRVEEIISKQNSLLAFYSASYEAVDLKSNTAQIHLEATPKVYYPGMKVEFLVEDGYESFRVLGVETENRAFVADTECQLSDKIDISVVLHSNGTEQMQLIQSWDYLFSESKLSVETGHWELELWADSLERYEGYTTIPMDTFIWPNMRSKELSTGARVEVIPKSIEHLVYVNRELVQTVETQEGVSEFMINSMSSADYVKENNIDAFCGFLDVTFIPQLNVDDELLIITIVTDNFDRRYIASAVPFVVSSDGRFDYTHFDIFDIEVQGIIESLVKY